MGRQRRFTDQACWDTVLRMTETCPLDEINVDALCMEAGFGRSTFYYHYSSLGTFLREMIQRKMTDSFRGLDPESTFTDAVVCLLHLIDSNRKIAQEIWRSRYREKAAGGALEALQEEAGRQISRAEEKAGRDVPPGRMHFQKEVYARLMLSVAVMTLEQEPEGEEWSRRTAELVGGMLDRQAC